MNSTGYAKLLDGIKARVRAARQRAATAVNSELVLLYWHIGREILKRQSDEGWGAKVIDRLSLDLKGEFPDVRGFSPRNLKYMREFAEKWPQEPIVQTVSAQLSWSHNTALLDKIDDDEVRGWYARQAVGCGWSLNVLVHQIAAGLYERQGKALTNFTRTLPPTQSDLARAVLKDPYSLEFEAEERDGGSRLKQTAVFEPLGLGGLLYWYALTPAHAVIFAGMARRLARRANGRIHI